MENLYTTADPKRGGELTEDQQTLSLVQRRAFMKLPLEERHRILAEQADAIAVHYQQNSEWQELQTIDLIEY